MVSLGSTHHHDLAAGSSDFIPNAFNTAIFWLSAAGSFVVFAAVLAPDRFVTAATCLLACHYPARNATVATTTATACHNLLPLWGGP